MRCLILFLWAVIAGVTLTLQSALAPSLEIAGARVDFVLIFAVFFALHAPAFDAVVVVWLVGFVADLLTVERPGLLALSYGLSATFVVNIRQYLFVRQAMTQFVLTLALCLVLRTGWLCYRHAMYTLYEGLGSALASDVLLGSAYTALCAPLIHRLLVNFIRPLGLQPPQRLEPLSTARTGIRV